jgi:cell division protein FtsI (penicillin-binding protein 3)
MAPRRRVRRGGLLLQRRRLAAVAACAALAYALLMFRAVQLHALDADWLSARAAAQHERTLRLEPLRGDLLDRHGELLAQSAYVESVAASPRRIDDPARVSRTLGRALGMQRSEVSRRLGGGGAFVWVKRWVTPDEADRVRRADLAGVQLLPERKRFYPNGDLAAAYLGFAGHDGVGLGGLELAFESTLRGRQQAVPALRDGRGQTLPRVGADPSARRGGRLVLALDTRLQHYAEQALDRARESTGARRATLVALDPRNGDLLALAERPSFNPNRFWEEDPGAFRARGFTDPFEPGSTLKPFVLALALEARSVTPSDLFDCENGSWRVLDRTIRDFRPHGVLSVHDILRVSSNIGAAKVANQLGSARLVAGLRRLGFGSRTGSGYPGEAPGVVHPIRETQAVERANLAFGQGLSVTALQLASAGAALANGGRRVHPRLALRLDANGEQVRLPSGLGEQVLPPEVARTVMDMMRAVVASGSGRAAALPRHAVAGKTGTAQKVIDGAYSRDRYVASFLGIVPADAPELVVVVVLDEPRGAHTGGAVAAPVFRDVAGFAVEQLAVPAGGAE